MTDPQLRVLYGYIRQQRLGIVDAMVQCGLIPRGMHVPEPTDAEIREEMQSMLRQLDVISHLKAQDERLAWENEMIAAGFVRDPESPWGMVQHRARAA
jgi:hypothetical protein